MKTNDAPGLVCITCPIGCRLTVERDEAGGLVVSGNLCPKGAQYAEAEILDPRRMVTATCRTDSPVHPRLPVRTDRPCPREKIGELLARVYALTVRLPVKAGDVVIEEFEGLRVIATRSLGDGGSSSWAQKV